MRNDKRGLELAFSTMVIMVLAILLLIIVVFMFTNAGAQFKDKISSFFSSSNTDSIINSCNNLASSESKYEYCCTNKTVVLAQGQKYSMSCSSASEKSWGNSINKLDCSGAC